MEKLSCLLKKSMMKSRRVTEPITCKVDYIAVCSPYSVQVSFTSANITDLLLDFMNKCITLGLSLIKVNEIAEDGTKQSKKDC